MAKESKIHEVDEAGFENQSSIREADSIKLITSSQKEAEHEEVNVYDGSKNKSNNLVEASFKSEPAKEEFFEAVSKEKKRIKVKFSEKDYKERKCENIYEKLKQIEDRALELGEMNYNINTFVIAAGIRYGRGESTLSNLFLKAINLEEIDIINDPHMSVPTIHVEDLAAIVKRIIRRRYFYPYIFGVDKTEDQTQETLIKGISAGIGSGKVNYKSTFSIDDECDIICEFDMPTIPSVYLNDEKDELEDKSTFNARRFNWTAEV